jgi:Flp pilus assembly protein TadG
VSGFLSRFRQDRSGAIAIYAAFVGTLMISAGVLAVDYGRLTVLKTQLQNAADAAALAGAAQLDGRDGARARATAVALNAATQQTGIGLGGSAITIQEPLFFFSEYPATIANGDLDARFVFVSVTPKLAQVFFQPVLNLFAGTTGSATATVNARAVATGTPIYCAPVPIRVCDIIDPAFGDLDDPAQAGRQLVLKESNAAALQIATFQLLCPPDTPGCTEAEAAQYGAEADDIVCNPAPGTPLTATGGAIDDTINSRYAEGPYAAPAENVINFDDDATLSEPDPQVSGAYGEGDWSPDSYWTAKHGSASPPHTPPVDLSNYSRYQLYLYESGAEFARNGVRTLFPAPSTLPAGFDLVSPAGPQIPTAAAPDDTNEDMDGIPDPCGLGCDPVPDPKRRVMTVALVTCGDAAPIFNGRYLDLFITRKSENSTLYTEIIGPVTPTTNANLVPNARLVE